MDVSSLWIIIPVTLHLNHLSLKLRPRATDMSIDREIRSGCGGYNSNWGSLNTRLIISKINLLSAGTLVPRRSPSSHLQNTRNRKIRSCLEFVCACRPTQMNHVDRHDAELCILMKNENSKQDQCPIRINTAQSSKLTITFISTTSIHHLIHPKFQIFNWISARFCQKKFMTLSKH